MILDYELANVKAQGFKRLTRFGLGSKFTVRRIL